MKRQDKNEGLASKKQGYEPPKAMRIPLQVREGLAGCLFTTYYVCGLTE